MVETVAVVKRYILERDEDRFAAGWGEHYWIVDTLEGDNFIRLLAKDAAEFEVERMNRNYILSSGDR